MRPWRDHLPPGVAPSSVELGGGSLTAAWAAVWASDPDAPLFFQPDPGGSGGPGSGADGGGRWWSAGAFEDATRTVAGRLVGAGLAAGDRVVWSTSSSVASVVAHVAALRCGLVVVPANTAYGERELAHLVVDTRASAAIVERPDQAAWVRDAAAGVGAAPPVVTGPGVELPDGDAGPLDGAGPGDPALIVYTSGTTGTPKGAVLTHGNLLAATEGLRLAWRWTPADRLVHCLPIFHVHGLGAGIYGTLRAGASAVLLGHFDPAAVVEAARTHQATLFFGVPTMYHRLVTSGRACELAGLRLCVSGSAPLSTELHGEMSRAMGSPVLERYGMTETMMLTSNPYDGPRRPGTVGFPLPGVEVTLADDGEILVRGPNVFGGYWGRPDADAESFVASGDGGRPWFRTGDLGVDDDGWLAIRGRSKDLVISGGYNVYPREVEEVLATHPHIAEVAVGGTPSQEWGEVVTAWIVPDGTPPTVEELLEFTAPLLAAYKRPRLVRIVAELPRNAMGKVVRAELP